MAKLYEIGDYQLTAAEVSEAVRHYAQSQGLDAAKVAKKLDGVSEKYVSDVLGGKNISGAQANKVVALLGKKSVLPKVKGYLEALCKGNAPGKDLKEMVSAIRNGAAAMQKVAGDYESQEQRIEGVETKVAGYGTRLDTVESSVSDVGGRVDALENKKTYTDSTARKNAKAAQTAAEEAKAEAEGVAQRVEEECLTVEQADEAYAKKSAIRGLATDKSVDAKVEAAKADLEKRLAQGSGIQLSEADRKKLDEANSIYDRILSRKKNKKK